MTKLLLLLMMFTGVGLGAFSQKATIAVNIKNAGAKEIGFLNNDYTRASVLFKERYVARPLNNGRATQSFDLARPIFVTLYYEDNTTKKAFRYNFYLSPGDQLLFAADADSPGNAIKVTGRGSENNQPAIREFNTLIDLTAFKKDSLPDNSFHRILEQNDKNREVLDAYIKKYRPSKAFVNAFKLQTRYFPVWVYIQFKGNQKYNIRNAFARNRKRWQEVEDSLLSKNPISEETLRIPQMAYFLPVYVTRIKEALWEASSADPVPFFKEWYGTNVVAGRKIFMGDMENDLRERIINRYFSGKTEEFLYATLFKSTMDEKQEHVPEIFERFEKKYPRSPYLPYIRPFVEKVMAQERQPLTPEMVLIADPDSLKTWADVLRIVKGKTVLLDMWGTWCGPCRREIQNNAAAIKDHFRGRGVEYLYIANFDLANVEKWKKLIPYYHLTGTHILAGQALTADIMEKVGGTGYPTYVIIKKDGSYELSRAGYPMERQALIRQLEDAMNGTGR
ncbi:TlpA family protein disulfide reductase [Niabella aurantiaca]|uniref:TlpA family protein disulfide reductase n=1 Tax=Niabella aurantiaca TaxID=379900 RepID=UPI000371533A|nr:TlpA disulfide reductase family protein [Niabella aurantiaca]